MFKKNQELKNADEKEPQSIEVLTEKMQLNRKRVEDQKQNIFNKITELKNDLDKPTNIKSNDINSFSIDDIEKCVEPKGNRQEIAKKIAALIVASELPIYSDKEYLNSIKEYLKAIRPAIAELEKKQWENLKLKKEKEIETEKYIRPIMNEYLNQEAEIKRLLKAVDNGLAWTGRDYENQISGDELSEVHNAKPFTDIIDYALKIDDPNRFVWFISLH